MSRLRVQLLSTFAAWCIAALGGTTIATAALDIRGYEPARHDRFYAGADPAFIGGSLDFSGVGRVNSDGGWATLISPHYFLSSGHANVDHQTLTFEIGNGASAVSHAYAADNYHQAIYNNAGSPGAGTPTDLYIGHITDAIDPGIKPFSIAALPPVVTTYPNNGDVKDSGGGTITVTDPRGNYYDREMYVYGLDHRVGKNRIDSIYSQTVGGTTGIASAWDYDPASDPSGAYRSEGMDEALTNGGDSGAPDFTVLNGQLALVGIRWFRTSYSDGTYGSGSSFVPDYREQVAAYVSAASGGSESVTLAVPEPTGLALFAAAPVFLGRRRKTSFRQGSVHQKQQTLMCFGEVSRTVERSAVVLPCPPANSAV